MDSDSGGAARVIRGGAVSLAGTGVRFLVQLVGIVVLARLLGPEQYGAAAVVIVVAALAEVLRTTGVGTVVIQRSSLGALRLRGLHAVACLSGAVAAVLVALVSIAAHAVTAGAPAPAISPIQTTLLLAGVFVATGTSAVPMAVLTRQLQLGRVMAIEIIATVCGTVTAVVLAYAGAGAISLFVQPVVSATIMAVVANALVRIRPLLVLRAWSWLRRDLTFAGNVLMVQSVMSATRNADKMLVAIVFGPTAAGLFSQASQLLTIPLDQAGGALQRVALPMLSRAAVDPLRLRRAYRVTIAASSALLWPTFAVIGVLATPIIVTLFGEEWAQSADLFRALVLAGFAQALGYVTVWLFIVTGQVRTQTLWTLVSRPIVLGSFLIGIPWGPTGMALSFSVCSLAATVPAFLLASRGTVLRLRDLVAPALWPAVVTVLASAGALTASLVAGSAGFGDVLQLVCGLAGASIGVVAVLAFGPARALALRILAACRRDAPTAETPQSTHPTETS